MDDPRTTETRNPTYRGEPRGVKDGYIYCDAFGCRERHPLEHEQLGEEFFGTGRWLGWVYLDLNRPDLFPRELRFCSVGCAQWWLDRESVTRHREPLSPLDQALRVPSDETARKRAGLTTRPPPPKPTDPRPPRPRRRKRPQEAKAS